MPNKNTFKKMPKRKLRWDREGVNKKLLTKYEDKIITSLKQEWSKIERGAKYEEIIRRTKETGMKVGGAILSLLLISGVLAVGAIAPNIFGAVGCSNKYRSFFRKNEFHKTKNYLSSHGYVQFLPTKEEGVYQMTLTNKGKQKALLEGMKRLMMQQDTKKWDKKWRIVLFDIPEKNKSIREAVRKRLRFMGLCQLQDSVFISPFPLREEIEILSCMMDIHNCIRVIETDNIGDDTEFKKIFNLG